jgi:hypothetical protein
MKNFLSFAFFMISFVMWAQITPGVYKASETLENGKRHYLLLLTDSYMVHSVYQSGPAAFISTLGGYYKVDGDSLKTTLEFNSDFEKTGERHFSAAVGFQDGQLILDENESLPYNRQPSVKQPLDGLWLFAARGPDSGQERRGDSQPRKTLKFLMDGYFQWIAYNVETMDFRGTGGGKYAADQGVYTEVIEYFSRDNSRVGAELDFTYERTGDDWHHTGKNSKGEPLYEIWSLRN